MKTLYNDINYFRSPTTKMIHMRGLLPEPKRQGFSQCGNLDCRPLAYMTRAEVRRAKDYEFCLKCCKLLGLK